MIKRLALFFSLVSFHCYGQTLQEIKGLIKNKEYEKAEDILIKKIQNNKSVNKLKILQLIYLSKYEQKKLNKALKIAKHIQKLSLNSSLMELNRDRLSINDIKKSNTKINTYYLFSTYQIIYLSSIIQSFSNRTKEELSKMRRELLFLIANNYKKEKSQALLSDIDSVKKVVIVSEKYKMSYFSQLSQSYYSKNFELVSDSEKVPMLYQGIGKKLELGLQFRTSKKGHLISTGFSMISGDLSVENLSTSGIDFFIKNKEVYAYTLSYTYLINNELSSVGFGVDGHFLTYNLKLPNEIQEYSEEGLQLGVTLHSLFEYRIKNLSMMMKSAVFVPSFSLAFDLGLRYTF